MVLVGKSPCGQHRQMERAGLVVSAPGSGMSGAGDVTQVCRMAIIEGNLYAAGASRRLETGRREVRSPSGRGLAGQLWEAGPTTRCSLSQPAGATCTVGGQFTSAGSMGANRVAKWNGKSWSPLGTGICGIVHAIAASGNNVWGGWRIQCCGKREWHCQAGTDSHGRHSVADWPRSACTRHQSTHLRQRMAFFTRAGSSRFRTGRRQPGVAGWQWFFVVNCWRWASPFGSKRLRSTGSDLCAAGST